MIEEKNLSEEIMSADELDNIVGGANTYVYYARVERPGNFLKGSFKND